MQKSLCLHSLAAIIAIGASVLTGMAGISYVPGVLMFVAAILILGLGMSIEDMLLARYDSPHVDDAHPPPLVAFRAFRAIVMIVLGVAIFVVVY